MKGCLSFTALLFVLPPLCALQHPPTSVLNTGTVMASQLLESQAQQSCNGEGANEVVVALCQLAAPTGDKDANIVAAKDGIDTAIASGKGVQMLVLPECWNSPYDAAAFPKYAEPIPGGPSSAMLVQAAKSHGIWLIGGSIPEVDESTGLVYNTCVVVSPQGVIVTKHRKVHLFDIDLPGKIAFRESDTLTGGDQVTTFSTPFGVVGVGICYDIRFPEYALLMQQRGASILVYPGAFNLVTGAAHWELLQRARAVDTQAFVLTASPARSSDDQQGYKAWGHSTVVTPWGEVQATTGHEPSTVFATLDLAKIHEMRDGIPTSTQRRSDLYVLQPIVKQPPPPPSSL
mmetsp:Transcript_21110/g.41842  ORF Transcript_21110/g.41842 Transcript_21110/m.41842 type:complete len:345 (+) Transcript_21110:10-1044(+)